MKRDKRFNAWSKTARIDKRNVHKARYDVRVDGVWRGFASKHKADWTRQNPGNPAAVYARGMSLSAIRELIEKSDTLRVTSREDNK